MFCDKCGTQVASDVQFCPNCGKSFLAPRPAAAATWVAPAGIKAHSGRWVSEGWQLVKADMGMYVLIALVVFLLNSTVPLILQGPLFAGFHIYCIKKILGKQTEFADVFKGFNFFVPTLVASLIIGIFVFFGSIFCIIPGLVLAAMYKFAYLFIVDKRMDFWPAMQASHDVVKNDYVGFTWFLILMGLVNILGALCCIVGLLVTIPVAFAAITIAYREIVGFDQRTVETI